MVVLINTAKGQIEFWISKFKGGDIDNPTYRQAIVDIVVNSVFLYDGELTTAYDWKDGTKTVMLSRMEAASENTMNEGSPISRHPIWTTIPHRQAEKNEPPKTLAGFGGSFFWGVAAAAGAAAGSYFSSLSFAQFT